MYLSFVGQCATELGEVNCSIAVLKPYSHASHCLLTMENCFDEGTLISSRWFNILQVAVVQVGLYKLNVS